MWGRGGGGERGERCFLKKSPPVFCPDLNLTNDPLCHVCYKIRQGFIRLNRRDGDDERKSISGRNSICRSKQAYISSTPGRALRTGGRLGGFLSFYRISVLLGVENLNFVFPPTPNSPWRRSRMVPRLSEHSERKRLCMDMALHDEDMVLDPPFPAVILQ